MTQPRDPDAIIATWLDEGPNDLPADTRRAIMVGLRTQPRTRQMAILRGLPMLPVNRVVAAAVLLVVGGWSVFVLSNRPAGTGVAPAPSSSAAPSPSPSPSDSASPEASIPVMTQAFTSATFGYSIRYPPDWIATARSKNGPRPGDEADTFDPVGGGGAFRALSVVMPDGVVVDDWISQNLTYSDKADCARPRNTLEVVTIDGHAGRLRGFCGSPTATEIEATVVIDNRVYLFTLFRFEEGGATASEEEVRAWFDAFAATITLNPQDAEGSPRPSSP